VWLRQAVREVSMIDNEVTAAELSRLLLDVAARLDHSVELVRTTCSSDQFILYRRAIGRVMAEILLEILNPLYEQHPMLKPPELD
jgi:hypothetical protein